MVLRISADITALELLDICHQIEDSLGRTRPYKNAPRTIDIDILMLDGMSVDTASLKIPHIEMESRAFVIFPLAKIAPRLTLPSGRHIQKVKESLNCDDILTTWNIKKKYGK
jgi:2-amino-4-hydroxy-6-hydroxymethyldihydropteridine diphosphokinase